MTATEVQNLQEAFVIANSFSIELSLALVLVLAAFLAVLWLFSLPRKKADHDS